MRYCMVLSTVLLTAVSAGCGGEGVETVEAPSPTANAKATLEGLAESGQPLGSGGQVIQDAINAIRETDAAKADDLQKDYDKLITLRNPAQIKATAKSMADKL